MTLPRGVSLDIDTLPDPCTREQLDALSCPDSARVGTARAVTPLLSAPLSGPVYLVAAGPGASLPGLAAVLRGEITIVIEGVTSFTRRGLTSRFGLIPDVPLSEFTLEARGRLGRHPRPDPREPVQRLAARTAGDARPERWREDQPAEVRGAVPAEEVKPAA